MIFINKIVFVCQRFDSSTIELLIWYEAIFGKEMWKHVITETTFWKHSKAAVEDRINNRKNLNDSIQESLWREKLHEDLGVPRDVIVPSVFIDPVVHIFVDPCSPNYSPPEDGEIRKFKEYTDK